MKKLSVLALLALVLLPAASGKQALAKGSSAPEIDLPTLQGGRVKLSTLRGHPVVLMFWGTWCVRCREEFPELVIAHRQYRERGLNLLAVNQSDLEPRPSDVQAFVKEFSVEFIVALDSRGQSRRRFRLTAVPTTVFIDSAGIIQQVHSGPINRVELALGLATILPPK